MLKDPTAKKDWFERRKRKAAERKYELAEKLNSNEMLISALRFYVAELPLNELVEPRPIRSKWRRCAHGIQGMRFHLEAAGRVLGIQWLENGQIIGYPMAARVR
jgi:hypothetical protein